MREGYEIEQRLQNIKPLNLTKDEESSFQRADKCFLCQNHFSEADKKARHHDHVTGKYLGATHMNCNLQCKQVICVPVIFHDLRNFDSHLLCQSKVRFLDSFAFLPSSIEALVNNLAQDGMQAFTHFQSEMKEHSNLLLRKGVYCYEYMSDWERFDEPRLPPRDKFYSSLTKESISDEQYEHAQTVFHKCNCKTLDYHDIDLKTEVFLKNSEICLKSVMILTHVISTQAPD